MSQTLNAGIAVVVIDIGKNSFHIVGHDERGAIVLRQKWSRGQVEARFANLPPCLVGMEACVGAHHLSRKLNSLGHDARLMPAKYVRPYSKGQCRAQSNVRSPGLNGSDRFVSIASDEERPLPNARRPLTGRRKRENAHTATSPTGRANRGRNAGFCLLAVKLSEKRIPGSRR